MVDMESSGSIDRDDFEEANSESNEVYKQELEAQMENIDIDNGDVRPRFLKPKTILLIVGGIILLTLATVAVVLLVNRIGEKSETAKVENVQKLANRYAHYIVDGNKDDDSDIGYKEMDGSLYIEKIFDSSTKKSEREDFVKGVNELRSELEKNAAESNSDKCGEDCLKFLNTNDAMIRIIFDHSNFDYSLNNFTKTYIESGSDGLLNTFEEGYKDLKKSFDTAEKFEIEEIPENETNNTTDNDDSDESSDEGDDSADSNDDNNNSESTEETAEANNEKANFYILNLAYEEGLVNMFTLYSTYNCFTPANDLDANCKATVDTSTAGITINEDLTETITEIKQSIEDYLNHVVVRSQWIAENLKEEND